MFDELFELIKEGAFSSREEFSEFAKGASNEVIFSLVKEGAFANIEEFNEIYGGAPVKKKEGLESFLGDGSSEPQESDAEAQDLQSFLTQQIEETPTQEVQRKYYEGVEAPSEAQIEAAAKADEEAVMSLQQRAEEATFPEYEQQVQADISVVDIPLGKKAMDEAIEEKAEEAKELRKEFSIIGERAQEDKFKFNLENITEDLIDTNEEKVVPFMNDIFKQYGFDFKPTDMFGDGMIVSKEGVAPLYVNLDVVFDDAGDIAENLKKYLEENRDVFKPEDKDKEKLIAGSDARIKQGIMAINDRTKDYVKSVGEYNALENQLIEDSKGFSGLSVEDINADPILSSQYQSYVENVAKATAQKEALIKEKVGLEKQGAMLDVMAGDFATVRGKQGDYVGGIYNEVLGGFGDVGAGVVDYAIDASTYLEEKAGSGLSDEDFKKEIIRVSKENDIEIPENAEEMTLDELKKSMGGRTPVATDIATKIGLVAEGAIKGIEAGTLLKNVVGANFTDYDKAFSEVLDISRKGKKYFAGYEDAKEGRPRNIFSKAADYADLGKGTLNAIRTGLVDAIGDESTTKQWTALESEGFIGGSILGFARSGPSMAAALLAAPAGTLAMVSFASDAVNKEISNDPDFADIKESEKMFVKAPLALTVGVLEKVGLTNLFKGGGMLNKLVSKVVGKSTARTTAKQFTDLVETEINSALAKGLIRVGAAGAAEFETGFLQEVADITAKGIYNEVKGKKMFENPDTFVDIIAESLYAGAQEAVGGGILGAPKAVKSAMSDRTTMSADDFNAFQLFEGREELKSIYVTKLKTKVESGLMTKEGAEAELAELNKGIGILKSNKEFFQGDAPVESKSEAFTILNRKKQLEQEIKGADPKLATPQIEELANINERLVELSKTKEDAIQEPSTETVDAQESAEGRPTMGETVPGTGTITEPTEVEADKAEVEEEVADISTKSPITISYNRNPEPAPKMGKTFGQDVEASGTYVTQKVGGFTPEGFETGDIELKSPLVIEVTEDTQIEYKRTLSQKYGGKKGKALSNELKKEGYDSIVTKNEDGTTGEIVLLNDITTYDSKIAQVKAAQQVTTKEEVAVEAEAVVEEEVELTPEQTIETQRVIKEVDGIIEKSKQRGRKFSEIPKNVLSYLQGTKLYENATDIQREQLFRDVRKKLGIKEKAAPSVNKILGVDPSKKVTMSQKQLVVQRIRDINKGAKDALRAFKSASTQVAKDVKEMVKSGNISTKQSAAIIKKFANVNMLKEKSIENFVEYMGRVFRDANYAENIAKANKLRKNAKKNIKRKIGLASAVSGDLQRIFAINPNLIPESVFNKYMELASEFGERKTVLNLSEMSETAKVVKDILDAVDAELSKIPELQDILESFENKVVDEKTGQLDYAKTIDKMKTEGVISQADADIMKTYKSEFQPKKVKEAKSEEEIEAERQETIKSISEAPALKVSELSSEYERQQGDKFNFLINSVDALDGLSLQELKQVEALIDNINNGYFPHLAQVMVEKMAANLKSNTMVDAIGNAKMLPLSKRIGAFKNMFRSNKKGAVLEMIKRNPLYYIDQLFGDFYGKPLYESLFEDTAKAIEQYEVAFKKVSSKIDKAEDAVYKSFKNNGNKTLMSKFKQMVYMIQLEYDSNLGNPEVNQAKAFIKNNIESIKDQNLEVYGASDSEMLQEILDKFTNKETGEIDAFVLYESFNKAEKASIKTIQEVNAELGPIAEQTAAIIRGESIIPRNNYVHLNAINKEGFDAMEFNAQKHRESLQPSTKAEALIKRTGAISALNFDVYKSATKGAKGVLLDFYMTEPVRTSKRTLNSTEKKLKESGDYNQEKRDIFNGIRKGWEESIDNQFNKAYQKSVFADRVLDWINRNGYRAILASAPRFIAELSSNTAFAMIASPKEFTSGAKIGVGFLNSDAAPEAMKNLESTNVTRIYPNGDMSGRMIDTNLMSGEGAKKAKSAKDRYTNRVDQVWSMTGSKWVKGVGSLADLLISTPDKIVMRPMWFGTFSVEFEKLTGQKPNLDKIAENDADYMSQYKEQLKESTKKADEASVMAGAASNPFMGTLRGVSKPDASAMAKMYNRFNNFMTTFLVYEYVTARTGVMNAIGRGNLSKKKGAALLGATASRMVGYTLMSSIMSDLFFGEEEEDEKDFDQQLGQAIASSVFSMGLGRDFGNATKAVINQFITEPVNEEFLTGLRNGDYNIYKDGLSYKVVPEGKMGRGVDIYDVLVNLTGPYSPLLKSSRFATSAFTKPDAKTEETQSKYDKEKNLAMLEVLGHLGVIPFYKDLRTLTRKQIYKDMNNMSKAKDDSVSTTPGYFRRGTKKKRRSRKRSSGKRRFFID